MSGSQDNTPYRRNSPPAPEPIEEKPLKSRASDFFKRNVDNPLFKITLLALVTTVFFVVGLGASALIGPFTASGVPLTGVARVTCVAMLGMVIVGGVGVMTLLLWFINEALSDALKSIANKL